MGHHGEESGQCYFGHELGKSLSSGLAAGIETRPQAPYGEGCAGDKRGSRQKLAGPWQWRNETQPTLITLIPQELLLIVPCLSGQLTLKHQQAERRSRGLPSSHVRPLGAGRKSQWEGGQCQFPALPSRPKETSWGKSRGRKSGGRKGQRGGKKKKYTKQPTALSHDFIKNWVFSKSSQDLLLWGEKKKQQAPSVYFLGWKPEQIQQIFTQGPSHV